MSALGPDQHEFQIVRTYQCCRCQGRTRQLDLKTQRRLKVQGKEQFEASRRIVCADPGGKSCTGLEGSCVQTSVVVQAGTKVQFVENSDCAMLEVWKLHAVTLHCKLPHTFRFVCNFNRQPRFHMKVLTYFSLARNSPVLSTHHGSEIPTLPHFSLIMSALLVWLAWRSDDLVILILHVAFTFVCPAYLATVKHFCSVVPWCSEYCILRDAQRNVHMKLFPWYRICLPAGSAFCHFKTLQCRLTSVLMIR